MAMVGQDDTRKDCVDCLPPGLLGLPNGANHLRQASPLEARIVKRFAGVIGDAGWIEGASDKIDPSSLMEMPDRP